MKTQIIALSISTLFLSQGFAQDLTTKFKSWYVGGVNIGVSKKSTIKINHLSSIDLSDYQFGFNQSSLAYSHRLSKKWQTESGYSLSIIHGNTTNSTYHRIHMGASRKSRLGKFRMNNSARLEFYTPQQQKFSKRFLLTNKWSYKNKKWPLRLSPFIRNQLYYYQGGNEITYWLNDDQISAFSEDGEDIRSIENAPNGWHRYRLTLGSRMRLKRGVALSLFYTLQREFNSGFGEFNELNVWNKSQTRIKRPFNNYSLVGMSLSYTLKLY